MTDCMHVRLVLEKCDLRLGSCLALPPRSSRLRITVNARLVTGQPPPVKMAWPTITGGGVRRGS